MSGHRKLSTPKQVEPVEPQGSDKSNKIVGKIIGFFISYYPLIHRSYTFLKLCLPAIIMFFVSRYFNNKNIEVLSRRVTNLEKQLGMVPAIDTSKWNVNVDYSSDEDN